jgi:glutathione S-transferase
MIKLFQFRPAFGLPNASPFCMKLETYLRLAGLPYQSVYIDNPGKAPKGKLPYVDDDGIVMADSGLAIEYLEGKRGGALDAWLTPEVRAQGLAFRRLFEENLYWAVLYSRWAEPEAWRLTRAAFFESLPWPLKVIIPALARRAMLRELWGHGMGRHSAEEIYRIGVADIAAAADFLADKPCFLGDRPSTLDATAFAFLANVLWVEVDSPLRREARRHANLDAYCRRIASCCFPEWTWPKSD